MNSTKQSGKNSKEVQGRVHYKTNASVRCGQRLEGLPSTESAAAAVKRLAEAGGKIIHEEQQSIDGFANTMVSAGTGARDGRHKIELGKKGEKEAEAYLEERGWQILERNWRAGRRGEIDLIARDSTNCLVFIEVKARRTRPASADHDGYHTGFESVQGLKQRKIIDLALKYLNRYGLNQSDVACRFDVLVVEFRNAHSIHENSTAESRPEIIHLVDAFHSLGWS